MFGADRAALESRDADAIWGDVVGLEPRYSAIDLPGGIAFHSPASLYFDVTPIERDYFDMFFFSALKSYKGAFHMSPDYAWWYGYAEVLGHLASIRDHAERLRGDRSLRRQTLFMISTGY